ncbi:hypothetical protein [Phycicoccus sp.]|uniref:hypothetical protein n=1 Tax=Phycicoccus sp. TaxID=1902410 RepID=UPI002CFA476C|nr:hypothetical protein [Phycicoccus sp.]HMM95323.1 hypothetical protein [Phycicoccus sp.]
MRGACSFCRKRRELVPIGRYGGGTYRRGGRTYWGGICEEDALRLAVSGWGQSSSSRYSVSGLRSAVETFSGWSRERTEEFLTDQNRKHWEVLNAREHPWQSGHYDPWPDYVAAKGSEG